MTVPDLLAFFALGFGVCLGIVIALVCVRVREVREARGEGLPCPACGRPWPMWEGMSWRPVGDAVPDRRREPGER